MKRVFAFAALMLLASDWSAFAQTAAPKPPPTYEQVIVNTWKNLHNKILTMAKDTQFPDDKLGWQPHPDSRSILEEFRHVTIGLEMTTALAKGEKFDFVARENLDAVTKRRGQAITATVRMVVPVTLRRRSSTPSSSGRPWTSSSGRPPGPPRRSFSKSRISTSIFSCSGAACCRSPCDCAPSMA